jgi:biopolymer transport protein ExbD
MRYPRRASKLKLITEISITPLMDLVFILLFAFMVAVPLVTQYDVSRQSGVSGRQLVAPPKEGEAVILEVGEDGGLSWAGEVLGLEALSGAIKQALTVRPELGVILQLHPSRSAEELVRLMTLLDEVGVSRTAVQLTSELGAPAAEGAGR